MSKFKTRIESTMVIIFSVMFIAFVFYLIHCYRSEGNIDDILNNPNFTGVVVARGTSGEETAVFSFGSRSPTYFIRVIGEHNDGTQVNHIFVVSEDIFNQFSVGDVISHSDNL